MVVFISDPKYINRIEDPKIVYNLSSLYSGFQDITGLITKIAVTNTTTMPINEYIYSPQFDFIYMGALFNDITLFYDFMKIMVNVYEGNNVIILVDRDDYRDAVMESIIKLIQSRYGYRCWIIQDEEDLYCLTGKDTFTPMGLMTLDADIAKFNELANSGAILPVLEPINKE